MYSASYNVYMQIPVLSTCIISCFRRIAIPQDALDIYDKITTSKYKVIDTWLVRGTRVEVNPVPA